MSIFFFKSDHPDDLPCRFAINFLLPILILLYASTATAETYRYDNHNRLYRVIDGSVTLQFNYDGAGNRIGISSTVGDYDFDGILDVIENAGCTDYMDADSDDDGISDGVEDANHNGEVDPGETNPCDNDSDGDGIQDGTELGYTVADNIDTAETFQPDLDPSTTTDPLSADSDNDWIYDGEEDANHNGMVDTGESDPLDQDTTDTDNDGLFDALENRICTAFDNPDTDGDTLLDGDEDSNHNGVTEHSETSPCDEDTDGDGLRDDVDPYPTMNPSLLIPINMLLLLNDDE